MAESFETPPYARTLDNVTKLFPLFVSVIVGILWFGDRVESPEEKVDRIKYYTTPLERELERINRRITKQESQLESHRSLGGHLRMEHRMESVEKRIARIEDAIKCDEKGDEKGGNE